jgi:sRNA-binding protein
MYLVTAVAGGPRFDLDSQPAGEVTAQAAEWARGKLAHIDARPAREARKAAEGRAWIEARRAAPAAAGERKTPPASSQAPRERTHVRPSSGVHRHSLADLRASTARRYYFCRVMQCYAYFCIEIQSFRPRRLRERTHLRRI